MADETKKKRHKATENPSNTTVLRLFTVAKLLANKPDPSIQDAEVLNHKPASKTQN